MKTFKNLYPHISSFANLDDAWRKARKGKRQKPAVAAFEFNAEGNLFQLQRELQDKTYRPGSYRSFFIQGSKKRKISAAPFRDRVVHHALCNVLEPIYERKFIHDSYANRKGKGTHRALDRAQSFTRRYPHVLKCDIETFFPAIDHAILRQILYRHIACPDSHWLINQIIIGGEGILADQYRQRYFLGDDLFAATRPRGLPIGNQTSQFWASVYLNPLDHFIKRDLKCTAYVRYVDDFLLFHSEKAVLHRWRMAIEDFLASLRLTIHPEKSVVFPIKNGLPYLGFQLFPFHRRLMQRNVRTFLRRFRRQRRAIRRGDLTFSDIKPSLISWNAHAAHGDTWRLRSKLFYQRPIPAHE
ncbi:Retron-type RNA-directed DNA polymerase [hydrothermal vent metagenome]|uniref:Retron-type RNA-directed DNA polymerase n=1 Tax=hydrothermal vent metagenome TaxID=652676 RepID=A0A3B0VVJ6_9ZZZZ